MADELAKARQALVDAEREVRFQPEVAKTFVDIANTYLRIEELKTQKDAIRAFREKRFN